LPKLRWGISKAFASSAKKASRWSEQSQIGKSPEKMKKTEEGFISWRKLEVVS